jgi:hypothetical protein
LRDFCESGKIGEKWAKGAKLPTPYPPLRARFGARAAIRTCVTVARRQLFFSFERPDVAIA